MKINFYLSFMLIMSTLIMLFISYISWKNRKFSVALSCSLLMVATSFYSCGYAFEIISTNLEHIKLCLRFEYLGIPFISVLWLVLVIQYTGHSALLNKKLFIILFTIPIVILILHFTNDFHRLFYKDMYMNYNGYFPIIILVKGPAYWVHIVYSYLTIIIGMILYIRMFFRSIEVIRKQIVLMLLAAMVPWISNIVYLYGSFGYKVDLEPFGFTLSGICYCWGILRFKFLRLVPIALTKVFESLKDAVVILDIENNVVNFNKSAKMIIPELGNTEDKKNNIQYIFEKYPQLLEVIKSSVECSGEQCIRNNKGAKYYAFSISTIYDNKTKIGRTLVFNDVTEQRKLMMRLSELASIDELTKLYNRRYFYERCKTEINKAKTYSKSLSLIILDLDHFKKINDSYGHYIGDQILKHISDICRKSLRETDIIARYGGEEFAILLPGLGRMEAVKIAERLRVQIYNNPYEMSGININLTSSFGVCGFSTMSEDELSDVMIKADRALYKAKEDGRNRVAMSDS